MAEVKEQRDFFISFNSTDRAYAEAINDHLREAGFTTYFHPDDIQPGGNIPKWMNQALTHSSQMLALCTPNYLSSSSVYSEAEQYARFWQDARGAEFKLIPVELKKAEFPPLMSIYKRIDAKDLSPEQAAEAVISALRVTGKFEPSVQLASKIFNIPYPPNPNFVGRSEAMEFLERSLGSDSGAITAIVGLGGIGKTTLAAEYCHRTRDLYGGIWWARAEQEPILLADLTALARRLGLSHTGSAEADAQAALNHVSSQGKRWLIVYDNAQSADAIGRWLPTGNARCLVTSRFTDFNRFAAVIHLDQWSDDVTSRYLLANTRRDDEEGAANLAHVLGGLPLAAEQAVMFLKNRQGITFSQYAEDIAGSIKRERSTGAQGYYPDTVFAAFVKSLHEISKRKDGETALDLLRLCVFLSPDGVDLELLTHGESTDELPANFSRAMADPFVREDVLAVLAAYSLLHRKDGPVGPILIFHRLVLAVARDWMGLDASQLWGSTAIRLVNRAFPKESDLRNPLSWPQCARLLPHITPLQAYAAHSASATAALQSVLRRASLYLKARGEEEHASSIAHEVPAAKATDTPKSKPKVFLVHGRDLGAMNEVARFLEKIGIDVVVLREAANAGRPIFNKFHDEAADIKFAVALMTPDDIGRHKGDKKPQPRARQNVIFELGFFIGKLGAGKVCALIDDSVERPSDYAGVAFIEFGQQYNWRWELARELRAAGVPFDQNNLI